MDRMDGKYKFPRNLKRLKMFWTFLGFGIPEKTLFLSNEMAYLYLKDFFSERKNING